MGRQAAVREPPPPGSKEGSPESWGHAPSEVAFGVVGAAAAGRLARAAGRAGPQLGGAGPGRLDPHGLMKAPKAEVEKGAPEESAKEKTVKGDAEVGKFVTGSGPNGVRVAPEMKCVGVDGKPSYCSARGATRESPARRQEATAVATTAALAAAPAARARWRSAWRPARPRHTAAQAAGGGSARRGQGQRLRGGLRGGVRRALRRRLPHVREALRGTLRGLRAPEPYPTG